MHTHTSVKGVPSFSLSEVDQVDLRKSGAVKLRPYMDKSEVLTFQRGYPWLISIGVLSLALVLLFYRLGDGSLHDWDEAIYAQVAKEMVLSDTWMSLTWNGTPFFHKPPLYFWLTALTYKMIGVNEFAARLWPAIFGFGVVVLTFVLGVRLAFVGGRCHSGVAVVGRRSGILRILVEFSQSLPRWHAGYRTHVLDHGGAALGLGS